ncbi:MAG TPA: glycosyltransferase family 4 protein [Solirubrobacteraceae bacterium]|nr:glycosyltransferase family 4 protein [Solirubrobacteraceae bacterium]
MNIVLVTRQYWPSVGGVERVTSNLVAAYAGRGHRVTVVAQSVDETPFYRMTHIIRERQRFAPFEHDGAAVVQFRPSRARRALLLPFAAELIPLGGRVSRLWLRRVTSGYYARTVRGVLAPLLDGADVVHMLGAEVLAVAAVETAHWRDLPVAVSPFVHPGEWGDDAGSVRAYRRADAVIATTDADAALYRRFGVEDRRLEVVGLPVPDAAAMLSDDERDAVAASARAEDPLVVFLGQRRPNKRLEILFEAIPRVWERHPSARFAFVGPGAPLPISDPRVFDVGRVSDADKGRWLLRADLLCLPSFSESFGLVVAEAWSQAVPVVVADIPVLRELVSESGGGLVSEADPASFAAAIGALLEDPGHARALGAAGHAHWQRTLTPAAVAERQLEIYERIIAERRARQD